MYKTGVSSKNTNDRPPSSADIHTKPPHSLEEKNQKSCFLLVFVPLGPIPALAVVVIPTEQRRATAIRTTAVRRADDVEAKVQLADQLAHVLEQRLEVVPDALCGNLHDCKRRQARFGNVSDR